jgi:ABC-type oligopeptide transport system substrate-binding subunit
MNLAVPPFDDPHVRKAVALVIDRLAIARELGESYIPADPATHVAPDAVEGGLLAAWTPDWLSDPGGDVEAARAEMHLSAYDADGDGRCDQRACEHVPALVSKPEPNVTGWSWAPMRHALARIGIRADTTFAGYPEIHDRMADATAHWALIVGWPTSWFADFPNGSTFFVPLLSSRAISAHANGNASLLGASPEQLEDWGYSVTEVPSVDDRIDRCVGLMWSDQTECWADLDRYLMTEIAPWVPLVTVRGSAVLSDRVDAYSFDPASGSPAFDQIALVEGSE